MGRIGFFYFCDGCRDGGLLVIGGLGKIGKVGMEW